MKSSKDKPRQVFVGVCFFIIFCYDKFIMKDRFTTCGLCPRNCKVNRIENETGICKVPATLKVARAALHYWEEPCISGTDGSGTVFFSGCSLHCVFCQNEEIAQGIAGKEITQERLAEIFLELQDKNANNINLVTPGHYVPHIVKSLERAKKQGLKIPVVYNTSSYENLDTIKMMEGLVDVYLPDFKYWNPEIASRYSKAPDYPEIAKKTIAEMVRQQPEPVFYEKDGQELIGKGVIVRQLLLPGQLQDAKQIVKYLYETYGNQIYLSLMSQFTPLPHVEKYPELNRKISKQTYESYIDYALELGVENGYIQEEDVATDSFIPVFDNEGV